MAKHNSKNLTCKIIIHIQHHLKHMHKHARLMRTAQSKITSCLRTMRRGSTLILVHISFTAMPSLPITTIFAVFLISMVIPGALISMVRTTSIIVVPAPIPIVLAVATLFLFTIIVVSSLAIFSVPSYPSIIKMFPFTFLLIRTPLSFTITLVSNCSHQHSILPNSVNNWTILINYSNATELSINKIKLEIWGKAQRESTQRPKSN